MNLLQIRDTPASAEHGYRHADHCPQETAIKRPSPALLPLINKPQLAFIRAALALASFFGGWIVV